MSIKIPSFSIKTCTSSFLTAMIMIPGVATHSNAQLNQGMLVSLKFPEGKDVGAPARTSGAGARGPACGLQNYSAKLIPPNSSQTKIPLTALTPENNILTTAAINPTVYVYVPQAADKKAEFRIIDTQVEEVIYQTAFGLVNTPGIVKISVPNTVNIKAEKTYQWQLSIICNPKDREADKLVEGWLKHTPLSEEQAAKIQQLKPDSIEQAKLYTEYGIWNEAVAILDKLRDRNPQAQTEWIELLESVNLEKLANVSSFECCQVSASP